MVSANRAIAWTNCMTCTIFYIITVFIESIKDFKYYKILIKSWRISRKMITFAPAK